MSRELDGATVSRGPGSYHQGVVRLRSREVEQVEDGGSLVEKRKSQLEGNGLNHWNYAESFHNFRKDKVKVIRCSLW